jgi:phenylacetate-CoA ligase
MTSLTYEKCKCGRTTARMLKIRGRSDDMLIIRGVNVFPTQIESVLEGIEEIGPHYEIIVTKNGHLDQMTINIELADGKFLEKFSCLEQISKKVDHKLKTVLGLSSKINIVQPRTLERFEGKAKRVKDLRNVN